MAEDEIIQERDFYALKYIVSRTLNNEDTQAYFNFLIGYTKRSGNAFPFEPLLRYARRNNIQGAFLTK